MKQEDLELRRLRFKDDKGNIVGANRAVSIVTDPAIELPYKLFKKAIADHKFQVTNPDKMEITGPVMIPNTPILRIDDITEKPYNIYFEVQDVKDAAELYLRNANHNQANFEHTREFSDKICLLETWFVEDLEMDKAKFKGFDMSKIPVGTWFMTYKVLDVEMWAAIKSGDYTGFSVEIGGIEDVISPSKQYFSIQEIFDLKDAIDEIPESKQADIKVRSKYTLLYNLIKDIYFSEGMDDEVKYRLIRKLLSKI